MLHRYSDAQKKLAEQGFAGQRIHAIVLNDLVSRVERIPWAEQSRTQRKRTWIRQCLIAVKQLEALLSELPKRQKVQWNSRRVRKVEVESLSKKRRVQGNPNPRVRRTLVTTLRIRRTTSKAAEERRLASITSKTHQHMKRQELRSRRRMHALALRMTWLRRSQDIANASDDIWSLAQERESPVPSKEDLMAWPRLAQRQRELLADNVQAFVRGNR